MSAVASAAASSGNIGPGFDVLALALELRCTVTATPAEVWSVTHATPHCPDQVDEDFVLGAAQAVSHRPLALAVVNEIPLGKGLGSSSAALAAASAAALRATTGDADPHEVFELVAAAEGHADNAAAAVYGGLVGVTLDGIAHQLPLALMWRIVVAIPEFAIPTAEARRVLPGEVERSAVVRSLSRFMALIEGLRTGDEAVLAGAAGDELHETPRARLHPKAEAMIRSARVAGAAHAAWSGAGPAIIAFATGQAVTPVAEALRATMGSSGQVRTMDIATRGLV